jgi:flavodoxin
MQEGRRMKKLDLTEVAGEFEIIDAETHLFYNTETGEFDYYGEYMEGEYDTSEKFEDAAWIKAPSQWDIRGYDIMVAFAEAVSDPRKRERLCVSLEGKGAFRRFKDSLHRVDLVEEWYAFKHKAYVELAREWCEENGIAYLEPSSE